jgi:putative hydrolase
MDNFRRFKDIDKNYVLTDKHLHTNWTDGKNSVPEMIEASEKAGMREVAFTDHVRSVSDYCEGYFRQIEEAGKGSGIKVLAGLEAKIADFDGTIDVPAGMFEKCAVRIGSVHRFPVGGELCDPSSFPKKECQRIEFELSLAAVKRRICNVLGHPGGMSLRAYGEFPSALFEKMIRSCAKNGVAFELNSFYHIPVCEVLLELLDRYDPYVSLGSDAHTSEEVGGCAKMLRGVRISVGR